MCVCAFLFVFFVFFLFLLAILPVGNRVGSSPAVQSEWNLIHSLSQPLIETTLSLFNFKMYQYHYQVLLDLRNPAQHFFPFLLCMWNNANNESSKQLALSRSAGMLSTNRPHIHSCCLLVHFEDPKKDEKKKLFASSTFPKTVPAIEGLFLFYPSFWFLLPLWAVFDSLLFSSLLLPSIQPVTPWLCIQAKQERVGAWRGGGGLSWGRQGHFC